MLVPKHEDMDGLKPTTKFCSDYSSSTSVSSDSDLSYLDSDSTNIDTECDYESCDNGFSFLKFRLSYLFVTLVVMLADGLQGKNFVK